MCTSETVVCFGIVMRSWQLIVAAHAFVKFSPLLRGIDIIIARQRNGTLRVEDKVEGIRSIEDMPLEVLEIIRGKVFDERALKRAARELAGVDVYDASARWRKIIRPHGGRNEGGCGCWDIHYEALFEVNLRVPSFRNPVISLSEYYGLELASLEMGNQVLGDWGVEDGSTSVVALPASMKKIKVEVDHDGLSRANGMKLPPQTNRFDSAPHFHRFYRDFHFDVVNEISTPPTAISTVSTTPSVPAVKTETSKETKGTESKSSVAKPLAIIKPECIVWTSTESCT